jgi:hypothetical protein
MIDIHIHTRDAEEVSIIGGLVYLKRRFSDMLYLLLTCFTNIYTRDVEEVSIIGALVYLKRCFTA